MALLQSRKIGGGIDESIFSDYSNFTKPSGSWNNSGLTSSINSGGYRIKDGLCYLYMDITPKVSTNVSFQNYWTNGGGNDSFMDFLPRPFARCPLQVYVQDYTATANIMPTGTGSGASYLRGEIGIKGTMTALPAKIILKGVYPVADDNQIN